MNKYTPNWKGEVSYRAAMTRASPNYSEVCYGEVSGRHQDTVPVSHADEKGPHCICVVCTHSLAAQDAERDDVLKE